jgi:hypothetical protein
MKPQSPAQPSLSEVRSPNQLKASVRKSHQAEEAVRNDRESADALAAAIFTHALESAGITRDEAAYLMGGISRSMVDQMCAPTVAKAPSLVQLLLLPPQFHLALIRELDAHFGLGRSVLAQVQQAIGTLGLLVR